MDNQKPTTWVKYWLIIGAVMILIQIVLGGITRLTGSGLSITKWDIVTGIVYPLNKESWKDHFELYKATPQFQKINKGISLDQFKFIFFWEYFHRLWARLMGFVFIIPLIYFLWKKEIPRWMFGKLAITFLLACFVASLGWIMVVSGLINRPWVNAYKLSFHLCAAILLLAYLLWIIFLAYGRIQIDFIKRDRVFINSLFILLCVQIFFGGVMSGMKASMVAPTWPSINGFFFPVEIKYLFSSDVAMLNEYEQNAKVPIVIQFIHRIVAYVIFILMTVLFIKNVSSGNRSDRTISLVAFILTLFQMLVGILTLINSKGEVPLLYGALHQLNAILLFCLVLYVWFHLIFKESIRIKVSNSQTEFNY
ncbi:MAG: COX15/CtaA family protein [Bacteroidota bacterium]|nr:COX15/CtaA family protein [Bacteroidota bacterium]